MRLPEWLLSTLACPRCKGPLLLPLPLGEGWGEGLHQSSTPTEYGGPNELHCLYCNLAYPIRNGVPVLLPEEAEPLPPSAS
jgi:uncharacterized protein YbaR (Trm112 family)